MKKTLLPIRQGDVLMLPLAKAPAEVDAMPKDPRGLVLAEGETSGHCHVLYGKGAKLMRFRDNSGRLLALVEKTAEVRVDGGGTPGHPRHEPVQLAPGAWEIRVQRAWDSSQRSRRVHD